MPQLSGGTPAPAPKGAGLGRSAPTGGGFNPNLMAMNIQARQTAARRTDDVAGSDREFQDIMRGDTQLTDESAGGTSGRSVLDAVPARSYTDPQRPDVDEPLAGGGTLTSQVEELESARQKERQMRRTQEQFTGEPTGEELEQASAEPQEQESPEIELPVDDEEEEEDEGENEAAMEMESQRMKAQNQAQEKIKDHLQKNLETKLKNRLMKRSANATGRGAIEGAEVAGSEVVVPLILLILQLNIQMINKYIFTPMFFKGWDATADEVIDGAPFFDQSFAEDVLTVFIDIMLTCNAVCMNPCCAPIVLIVIIVAAIANALKGTFDWIPFVG